MPTLWSYGILNFFSRYLIAEEVEFLSPLYPQTFAKSTVLFANHLSVIFPNGDSPGFPTRKISIIPHKAPELADSI